MTFPTPPALLETPTNEISLPLVRCAALLASCAEVRTMLGVGTAQEALDKIDYPLRDVETYGEPIPGIIVEPGTKQKAGYNGDQSGEVVITLFDAIHPDYAIAGNSPLDFKNDALAWMNRVGVIWSQMKQLSKTALADFGGVRWDAIRWQMRVPPEHFFRELGEDTPAVWFRLCEFSVEWIT